MMPEESFSARATTMMILLRFSELSTDLVFYTTYSASTEHTQKGQQSIGMKSSKQREEKSKELAIQRKEHQLPKLKKV